MGLPKSEELINIGSGEEASIADLAGIIRGIVGYTGGIRWDDSKPDGMPRRFLDSEPLIGLDWKPVVPLEAGLRLTYAWYLKNIGKAA
jgi:GDP-L-fucose synthase